MVQPKVKIFGLVTAQEIEDEKVKTAEMEKAEIRKKLSKKINEVLGTSEKEKDALDKQVRDMMREALSRPLEIPSTPNIDVEQEVNRYMLEIFDMDPGVQQAKEKERLEAERAHVAAIQKESEEVEKQRRKEQAQTMIEKMRPQFSTNPAIPIDPADKPFMRRVEGVLSENIDNPETLKQKLQETLPNEIACRALSQRGRHLVNFIRDNVVKTPKAQTQLEADTERAVERNLEQQKSTCPSMRAFEKTNLDE